MKEKLKDCLRLYGVFCKIGAVTFGGGYAMLPILEAELAGKRQWADKQDLLDFFAIGQSLPGIIAINVATFVGSKRRGFWGAVAAALGMVTPSIIVISAIAAFLGNFTHYPLVQKLLAGLNVGVAALLVQSVVSMAKKAVLDWVTALLAVAAFVSMTVFGLNNVILLAAGILVGLWRNWGATFGRKAGSAEGGTAEPDACRTAPRRVRHGARRRGGWKSWRKPKDGAPDSGANPANDIPAGERKEGEP